MVNSHSDRMCRHVRPILGSMSVTGLRPFYCATPQPGDIPDYYNSALGRPVPRYFTITGRLYIAFLGSP